MSQRYAVIGNPVAHSKSPRIHAAFAAATRQDMVYEHLHAERGAFAATVDRFRCDGGAGLNVTLPFKLEAFAYADRHSERAAAAKAANTLKFERDGCYADNTDGAGLLRDLQHNLGLTLNGRRVLIMGAGGATRGVLLPLLAAQPAQVTIVNRSADKAHQLAADFAPVRAVKACGYAELYGAQFDLVINATSASLHRDLPPLPAGLFAADAAAYDMMYGAGDTQFMAYARREGALRVHDGLGMLVEQAAESFYLWRGVRPATAAVIALLRRDLNPV